MTTEVRNIDDNNSNSAVTQMKIIADDTALYGAVVLVSQSRVKLAIMDPVSSPDIDESPSQPGIAAGRLDAPITRNNVALITCFQLTLQFSFKF